MTLDVWNLDARPANDVFDFDINDFSTQISRLGGVVDCGVS